jgi:hypothetical protein
VGVAVQGPGQHILGGDEHAKRLGEQRDGGRGSSSMIGVEELRGCWGLGRDLSYADCSEANIPFAHTNRKEALRVIIQRIFTGNI